jgi:gamma-glutamyltranspeptidase/glutathione hydrolase
MHINKQLLLLLITGILTFFSTHAQAQQTDYKPDISKKIMVSHAAVVTAHPLASKSGLEMLKNGGNAFDAAITTQLVLAVVYPNAGNLGGGGFMIAHTKDGKNLCLDFREIAPEKAFKDMYLDSASNPITGLSQDGHLACGVPGTVSGIFKILKYARLPLQTLIAPAIEYAENGFKITAAQAEDLNELKNDFIKNNFSPVAFVREAPWKAGDVLIQPDLANTLKRIQQNGLTGFYEGPTAQYIVDEMKKGNGIISLEDLKNYEAKSRTPMEFEYKNNHIVTMPLPSSGGIILKQLLKMTAFKNMSSMGFQTPECMQLIIEAERRAFADRAHYLGDPDFVKVPVQTLTSDGYLQTRINNYQPGKSGNSNNTKAGVIHESEETTHISILDDEGNAIAITTTLNDSYGSKTIVSKAGFILNNEMDDFSIKPGVPNLYGVTGNEANAIAPRKKMLSSMTPTIVLNNNKPVIVIGTPGGSTIPTNVFQTITSLIDFKMSPEDAVNLPKFHFQWLPDEVFVEHEFSNATKEKLAAMGYNITERGYMGRTELIQIDYKNGKKITAIADKRGDDAAAGY